MGFQIQLGARTRRVSSNRLRAGGVRGSCSSIMHRIYLLIGCLLPRSRAVARQWKSGLRLLLLTVIIAAPGAGRLSGDPSHRRGSVSWDGGTKRLEYRVANGGTRCSLRLFVRDASPPGPISTSSRVDVVNDGSWAEIKLALPVRVERSDDPQLLVKLYRSNWLDYELYTVSDGSCERAFVFSCRDETTIRWVTRAGKLQRIITYDRFEPVPERLQKRRRIGWPWEQVTEWHYEPNLARWTADKSWWVRHRFDESEANAVIRAPADCRFRFAR